MGETARYRREIERLHTLRLAEQAVLDAALAWLDAFEGKSEWSLVRKDQPLAEAIRAYRAAKGGT